jgi:integral membrane protein
LLSGGLWHWWFSGFLSISQIGREELKRIRVGNMTQPATGVLTRFRVMAILCGVNLLLLVFGYMPAKHIFDLVDTNKWMVFIPIAHGYLYIVYILTALQIGVQKKMSLLTILVLIAAGTLPFASFIAERKIVKKYS